MSLNIKSNLRNAAQRIVVGVSVVGISLTALVPLLSGSASAAAYTQLTARSIQLSNSAPSATGVSYNVSFTTSASYTIGSVVIEICTDPFVGTTCTTTGQAAGFSWNTGTSGAVNSSTGITGLSVDTADSTASKLVLTRTAGVVGASVPVNFTMSGVSNPTATAGTYYARIYTISGTTGSLGTLQDAGGDALSTANVINITAKVQESLTFCAYTTNATCALATGTALNIGDGNGVLSSTTANYQASSFFNIYSNATTGVAVRLKGSTLTSGANTITAQSSATCVADSTTATVEQFGLRVTGGTGFTPNASSPFYNCASTNHALDTAGMSSTYGSLLGATAGPTAEMQNTVEYNAKASTTTKPGIYTAAMTFIATGVY
jgi:hypothetical protein